MRQKLGHPLDCNCLGRRNFLKMAGGATVAGITGGSLFLADRARADALSKELRDKLTPEQIIQAMKKGNKRFRMGERKERNYLREQKASAKGQYPAAVLLTCIDSRAPAEVIMDLGIGDIFNCRVAGNVRNADILGSMEFACKLAGAKVVRQLFPLCVSVRYDRRQEAVGPAEHFCFAFEFDLSVLVERVHVNRHARIEYRIQLVSIGSTEEQLNHLLHLFRRINLCTVKRRLQIMKLVRVGFLRKQCRSVIVLKSKSDRLAIVSEIEHETIVLLWARAIEPRKRLHRLYARERFVHVHGMQQRLTAAIKGVTTSFPARPRFTWSSLFC
jgi:hypothetical protein